ncbi:type IV secretory system conjugative DNA transfer family protein [Nisaea sp.]|uniref:type IV secretory system conjugative DNA transfer family protein n=1 Tax=Nisaea sp. TaxID=2024842 RepID=UPI00329939B1
MFGFGKKAREQREAREREALRLQEEREREKREAEAAAEEAKRQAEEAQLEADREQDRQFSAAMDKIARDAIGQLNDDPPSSLVYNMGWMIMILGDGKRFPHLRPHYDVLSVQINMVINPESSFHGWLSSDIACNYSDKSEHHISLMKALGVCYINCFLDIVTFNYLYTMFLYNDGKCRSMGWAIERFGGAGWSNDLFERTTKMIIGSIMENEGEPAKQALADVLGAGNNWATIHDIEDTIFTSGPHEAALLLGDMKFGEKIYSVPYLATEGLVAIAPPGSGKTQALVLPNLVRFPGPALVLDIKGECYAKTSRWREANVGPVLRFAPSDPDNSAHYNPLDMVSSDPRKTWKDARLLADMLVVPKGRGKDDYFEQRGRDLVTALIMVVALEANPEGRHMGTVMDLLYPGEEEFAEFLERCKESKVDQLRRTGNMLATMPDKQREGVYDSARTYLEIWQSHELVEISRRSDWKPDELRAKNLTLYLCVGLNEVTAYASVLRVIIGQIIHAETQGDTERRGEVPMTFFLDEMPRLGYMAPIEEALDVGRGYGVRLWMFAQNFGQLADRYENAKGMIGNCGVEIYMNPDADTARSVSSRLGERSDVFTGAKKPLADAVELAGPDYNERIIALGRGCRPLRFDKAYAFSDPKVSERLDLPQQVD